MRRSTKSMFQRWEEKNRKNYILFILLQFLLLIFLFRRQGTLIEISGKVTDQEKNLPLPM